jgi:glyoxylase-like metal-dependent hydrolase (beta-lactamase superfamily II)
MEVAEGVHRLTRGVCNFYLIEEGGKLVLVDAGAPKDWNLLLATVSELGRRVEDLDAILLTHAHSDHTGFAERARSEAGSRVWIHSADEQVAKTGKEPGNDGKIMSYLFRAELYRTASSLIRRGGWKIVPIAEVSTFPEGDLIDVPGKPRVAHIPGHTVGSSALVLEDRGVAMTGDALVTRNPLTGRIGPQIMPAALNQDTDEALRSLDRLEGVTAELVLPGHGEPWTQGMAEAVRAARAAGRS